MRLVKVISVCAGVVLMSVSAIAPVRGNTYLTFDTLKSQYVYDATLPLDAALSDSRAVDGGTAYQLTFRGADGILVYGDVTIPDGDGAVSTVDRGFVHDKRRYFGHRGPRRDQPRELRHHDRISGLPP